ncbi:MAG: hypothetical protein ACODAE_08320 [Gemmatimonadota bacterium]
MYRAAVAVAACGLLFGGAACERGERAPATIDLDGRTVRLPAGASLHTVTLRNEGDRGDIEPETLRARPGDAVRFVAADDGGHAVAFERDALPARAADFLARTGQLRGAPLIRSDAAWIVDLSDAPTGSYPFRCVNTGARGRLIVSEDDDG